MRKFVFILVFVLTGFIPDQFVYGMQQKISILQQTKEKYITVFFPKIEDHKMNLLLSELESYNGKISDIIYNSATRHLTLYYTDQIKLDDIFQVYLKYTSDFEKVSGTELQ